MDPLERINALKRMVEVDGVPTVDANDLLKLWKHTREISSISSNGNQQVAIDVRMLEKDIRPGANFDAIWFRASLLGIMAMPQLALLDPWMHDGELDPVVFRVMAEFPLRPQSEVHGKPPFGEIVAAIKKAAEGKDVN